MTNLLLLIAGAYLSVSVVTLLAYAADKRAAVKGRSRTPERALHLLELLGGWPGGVLARRWLRHKSRDLTFRIVSWSIIALHAVVLAVLVAYGRD